MVHHHQYYCSIKNRMQRGVALGCTCYVVLLSLLRLSDVSPSVIAFVFYYVSLNAVSLLMSHFLSLVQSLPTTRAALLSDNIPGCFFSRVEKPSDDINSHIFLMKKKGLMMFPFLCRLCPALNPFISITPRKKFTSSGSGVDQPKVVLTVISFYVWPWRRGRRGKVKYDSGESYIWCHRAISW